MRNYHARRGRDEPIRNPVLPPQMGDHEAVLIGCVAVSCLCLGMASVADAPARCGVISASRAIVLSRPRALSVDLFHLLLHLAKRCLGRWRRQGRCRRRGHDRRYLGAACHGGLNAGRAARPGGGPFRAHSNKVHVVACRLYGCVARPTFHEAACRRPQWTTAQQVCLSAHGDMGPKSFLSRAVRV